jgi:O-antigen/teichoic acid export membrane protein
MPIRNLLNALLAKFSTGDNTHADRTRIIHGLVHSLIIQGGSALLILVGNLLMARWTGPDAYGQYIHVFNWISILGVVALCGQEDLALAGIPRYLAENQPGRVFAFVRRSNRFILISSTVVILFFLVFIWLFPVKTIYENRYAFLPASLAIYGTAFLALNQNILQAMHFIRLSQWVEKLIKPALLILFFGLAQWMFRLPDGRTLVFLAVLTTMICCLVLMWLIWKKVQPFQVDRILYPRERTRGKLLHFFAVDLLYLFSIKITMLVLPFFSAQREVGIFNVSYRFADLVIFPFFLLNAVVPQLFSEKYKAQEAHKQFLYHESSKFVTWLTLPVIVINIVAGKVFLGWFGKDFVLGYSALIQLSIAKLFYPMAGPAHTVLTMLDKEKYAVWALSGYVLIVLVGNLLLVPSMGLQGGTLSILIGSFCYNTTLALMAWRFCGVRSYLIGLLIPASGRRAS